LRLLLDTHVFLWWRENSPRLTPAARRAIAEADDAFVSAASAWEVAVKMAVGKLTIPGPFEGAVEESGFSKLVVEFRHAATTVALPLHHGDPFDRMLIAQALTEGLALVTHDRAFAPYGVPILWT
jgi:PIN domain nuclease of toxin-antitoxin system